MKKIINDIGHPTYPSPSGEGLGVRHNAGGRGLWLFLIAILVLLGLVLLMVLYGCNSNRHINKTTDTTLSEILKEKEDSIRLLINETNSLQAFIHELVFGGVVFDSSGCPPATVVVPPNCKLDSILSVLDLYKDKVKIYADGTIEAEGKLKSAYYTKNLLSKTIEQQKKTIDSLVQVKQKELVSEITNTVTVQKDTKWKVGTNWWIWLIFFIAGFALCYWLFKIKR